MITVKSHFIRVASTCMATCLMLGPAPYIATACEGGGGLNDLRISPPTYRFKKAEKHLFTVENFTSNILEITESKLSAETPEVFKLLDPNKCLKSKLAAVVILGPLQEDPGECTYEIEVASFVTGKSNHFKVKGDPGGFTETATIETGP